jgi:hypothetical protein
MQYKKSSHVKRYAAEGGGKVAKVMKEFGSGKLSSSSGGKVTNPKQAVAIALSEARKAGEDVPPPPDEAR